MSGNDEKDAGVELLTDQKIAQKYKDAAAIANGAIRAVMALCVPDAKVVDLCVAGDAFINAEVQKKYNKPKVEKGISFPTCVSVNNTVGHYCPHDGDELTLKLGDLVKIDLGAHIDGFIAVVANTILVGASGPEAKITGRQADVMAAAWTAAEAAVRLLKPGKTNADVSAIITKAANEFKCTPVQGVLSHQMSRFVIDGAKVILNKPDIENKVDLQEFAPNEVYALDIVMSTSEGKARESPEKTTIFKRAADANYQLKLKASRATYSVIKSKHATFPFTLRSFEDKKARFGIVECVNHQLVHPYPVLMENAGEYIAHIKFTCMIMPNSSGTVRITEPFLNRSDFATEHTVTDKELLAVLATSTANKKKKKKKKKKTGEAPAAQ